MSVLRPRPPIYRALAVLDRVWIQVWWCATCVVLVVATWHSGVVARWFVAPAALVGALSAVSFVTGHGIRRVRLAAAAWAAVSGAVLTMVMAEVAQGSKGDQDLLGAVFIALLLAAIAGWIADDRMARAADRARAVERQLSDERHEELLSALAARQPTRQRSRLLLALPAILVAVFAVRRRR